MGGLRENCAIGDFSGGRVRSGAPPSGAPLVIFFDRNRAPPGGAPLVTFFLDSNGAPPSGAPLVNFFGFLVAFICELVKHLGSITLMIASLVFGSVGLPNKRRMNIN